MNLSKKIMLAIALLCASAAATARTIEMNVNGLVCAFCAQGIEKTLKGFPQATGVFVSLENRIVAVALKDGTDIDDATLRKAITDAGYTVVSIQRSDTGLDAIRERVKQARHRHE